MKKLYQKVCIFTQPETGGLQTPKYKLTSTKHNKNYCTDVRCFLVKCYWWALIDISVGHGRKVNSFVKFRAFMLE